MTGDQIDRLERQKADLEARNERLQQRIDKLLEVTVGAIDLTAERERADRHGFAQAVAEMVSARDAYKALAQAMGQRERDFEAATRALQKQAEQVEARAAACQEAIAEVHSGLQHKESDWRRCGVAPCPQALAALTSRRLA